MNEPKFTTQGQPQSSHVGSSTSPDPSRDALDAARFAWYFSDKPKGDFLMTYLDGMRAGWTTDQWRAAIDAAMQQENGNV